jgi:hypothetical protein
LKFHVENGFPLERWDEMDAFLEENYREQYVLRQRPLFSWQFQHPQYAEHATVLCARRQGRLVGILGYIPKAFFWGELGKSIGGAWMANWMVSRDARQGVGWILMRRLQELYPILLGQGANTANEEITTKMGFEFFPRIPRYGVVFDPEATATALLLGATAEQVAKLRAFEVSSFEGRPRATVKSVLGPDDMRDFAPDWSLYQGMRFGTVRDAAYLKWRYFDHPVFDYRCLMSGTPDRPAICVFRIEETSGDAHVLVGRIVELFAPQDEAGRRAMGAVLYAALDKMRSQGCLFCDFFCGSREIGKMAETLGLHLFPEGQLPSRLSPVERGARPQNLEVWSRHDLSCPEDVGDIYVTKADGDQDRPNA